jgi:sialic acid synthase SpsE
MPKVLIIAEIGNMHEGSVGLACKIAEAAVSCGADAVKLQTHIFEAESLQNAPSPAYFNSETRESYFKRTAFSPEQYLEVKKFIESLGAQFISSPFSIEAIDLLQKIGLETFKVPSGEVNNLPYLKKIAKIAKKVILSSGMSYQQELDQAVETLRDNGCLDLTILQCTSQYPCQPENVGLDQLGELKNRYNLPIGLSDHTMSLAIPAAAVVLGAQIIEKHFVLSRLMYGSDAKNSLEPAEFKQMVQGIREVEQALNSSLSKDIITEKVKDMKDIFEKSLVASKDLAKDTAISEDCLAYKKPGDGIKAKDYERVLGKKLKKDVPQDHKFSWDDLE